MTVTYEGLKTFMETVGATWCLLIGTHGEHWVIKFHGSVLYDDKLWKSYLRMYSWENIQSILTW